jgi:hypothetical protein
MWTDMAEGGMFTELTPLFRRDKIGFDLFLPLTVRNWRRAA